MTNDKNNQPKTRPEAKPTQEAELKAKPKAADPTKPKEEKPQILGVTLDQDEEVVLTIKRARIGLIFIWAVVALMLGGLLFAFFAFNRDAASLISDGAITSFNMLIALGVFVAIFGGAVVSHVYNSNTLVVTSQRLIQRTALSLFAESMNIIELSKVEDVSLSRAGIAQYIFHYGTLRLSTVGDETTYTFPWVDTPSDEIDLIANLIQTYKEEIKATKWKKASP